MDCCREKNTFQKITGRLTGIKEDKNGKQPATRKVALVGSPNVGKSVIFNSLTGAYVTVSNYPGTTVEISRGSFMCSGTRVEILDTPGMYSMLPITEEEKVTRRLLIDEKPDLIVHVADAKNLGRMLPLTLQLIESGIPTLLVLNIMDEARLLGIDIDCRKLEDMLGIPVIESSAALNKGLKEISDAIRERLKDAR